MLHWSTQKSLGKQLCSLPLWFSNEIYNYAQSQNKIKSKIYFMCGDNESADMVADLNRMETLINSKRCSWISTKENYKGGQHNEKLWRDGFVQAINLKFNNRVKTKMEWFRTFDLKLQHTFSISRKIYKYMQPCNPGLKERGVSGFGKQLQTPTTI
jgi:hypothetical protein